MEKINFINPMIEIIEIENDYILTASGSGHYGPETSNSEPTEEAW